jgi:hypothetical protein
VSADFRFGADWYAGPLIATRQSGASLKVDFQGSRVTSDGGLIVIRELDERLGLGDLIAAHLSDARRGKNTKRC